MLKVTHFIDTSITFKICYCVVVGQLSPPPAKFNTGHSAAASPGLTRLPPPSLKPVPVFPHASNDRLRPSADTDLFITSHSFTLSKMKSLGRGPKRLLCTIYALSLFSVFYNTLMLSRIDMSIPVGTQVPSSTRFVENERKRRPTVSVFTSTVAQDMSISNDNQIQSDTQFMEKKVKHRPTVGVFYNVYAKPEAIAYARKIAIEQMLQVRPEHRVFVRSIGVKFNVLNAIHVQHNDTGWEKETLRLLWDYCHAVNPNTNKSDDTVVYIHNKGSFHPNDKNDLMRRWLTQAALSEDCANMPPFCNVCSFRMSPLPHPHTPGNMWSAKCDYVKKLMDPVEFEQRMDEYYHVRNLEKEGFQPYQIGTGRFAAEHWVHSHPSVAACDLSTSDYVLGYVGLPQTRHEMRLMRAPRYERDVYVVNPREAYWMNIFRSSKRWFQVGARLDEYKFLYNETPPQTWFGWSFYNETV